MDVSELFSDLALGELSNLGLVEAGAIRTEDQNKIILHTNEGLERLHTRFMLKESNLFVEQKGYLTTYQLKSEFAYSNYVENAAHTFYINDRNQPFKDDLVKVLEVWDGFGRQLPLNESRMWLSVFTPQPTVLQIPHPREGATLALSYQANHPKLQGIEFEDMLDQTIDIPRFLKSALTAYIAHKVYKNMNTQESSAKAAEHLREFDTICGDAIAQDLVTTGETTGELRFERNGWV